MGKQEDLDMIERKRKESPQHKSAAEFQPSQNEEVITRTTVKFVGKNQKMKITETISKKTGQCINIKIETDPPPPPGAGSGPKDPSKQPEDSKKEPNREEKLKTPIPKPVSAGSAPKLSPKDAAQSLQKQSNDGKPKTGPVGTTVSEINAPPSPFDIPRPFQLPKLTPIKGN